MAQVTLPSLTSAVGPVSRVWRSRIALPGWLLPAAIVALGFALRLFRIDQHSMWVDEVYTVEYSRLPWPEVLGLHGPYDNHPPLYYTLVKVFALVFSEPMAARVLSLAAGTATIAVVYALTRLLVNSQAATLASLILALSPLHIWYSQDGRMYAPTAFAVAVSYYALVRLLRSRRPTWGVAYALTLLLAMLLDYSALYGLAPQVTVVAHLAWRERRIPREWLVSATAAGVLYLPWAVELIRTIYDIPGTREFLIVTRNKIFESILTVLGFPGEASYYWGAVPTPWSDWPQFRPMVVAIVAALLFLSAVTLCDRYRLAFVTGGALLGGTVLTAAVLSYLVSPGYADRTVIFATMGWAMLAGSAPYGRMPNGAKRISLATIAAVVALSSVATANIYQDAQKEPYASAAHVAASGSVYGFPIFADEFMGTAITAYHPGVTVRPQFELSRAPALFYAYGDYAWTAEANATKASDLDSLGYERVLHQKFDNPVSMAPTVDLYVRESVTPGVNVGIPDFPAGYLRTSGDASWKLLASETDVIPGAATALELVVHGNALAESPAVLTAPASGGHIYLTSLDYWVEIPAVSAARVTIECLAADATAVATAVSLLTGTALAGPGWLRARTAIICPEESTMLRVTLANAAVGEIRIRNVQLFSVAPLE